MNQEIKNCPHCGHPPTINGPYTLSDKPAWDLICSNQNCKFRPVLWEQRDREKMIELWNTRFE